MRNYIHKGDYNSDVSLAPNNAVGRLGSELYQHTAEGWGALAGSVAVLVFCIPFFIGSLFELAGGAGMGWMIAAILLGIINTVAMTCLGSLTYAYIKCQKVNVIHLPSEEKRGYARSVYSKEVAQTIANAHEKYRALPKHEREIYKPVMVNMDRYVKAGKFKDAFIRAEKFNEVHAEFTAQAEEAQVDNSDLEYIDNVVKGAREIRQIALDSGRTLG